MRLSDARKYVDYADITVETLFFLFSFLFLYGGKINLTSA